MPVFSEDLLEDSPMAVFAYLSAYKVSPLMELHQGTSKGHLQVLLAKIRVEFIIAKGGIIMICLSPQQLPYF